MTPEEVRKTEVIRRNVLGKNLLSDGEKSFILMILTYRQLYPNYETIFVTSNNNFLKNRNSLKPYFYGIDLRIVPVRQALQVMDLYAKSKYKYYTSNHSMVDKKQWYLLYFRSKIPYFHYPIPEQGSFAGEQILDALASRFIYLLISLDEIGIQFYFGKYKDLMTSYHFNYLISLVTGIFDNFALETRNKYSINFKGDNIPSRISIYNKTGKQFLKQIRNRNPSLRNHINNEVDFINLIYELREPILLLEVVVLKPE
jgi:hypothetical protein